MSRKASKLICKVSKSIIIIIFKSAFFLQSSIIALTKTGIALAETGDVSSSQGSQEMEVEAPTSRGDGGGGNVAKDKVQGGDTVKGGIKGKRGKRKRKGWDKHKKGEKGRGKEDIARKAKVDDKIEKIMRAKENLENPYDEMDIDTKKSHALFFYNDEMSQMLSNSEVAFSTRSIAVKERVAKKVGVSVRTMKRWVLEYWSEEEVKKSRGGNIPNVRAQLTMLSSEQASVSMSGRMQNQKVFNYFDPWEGGCSFIYCFINNTVYFLKVRHSQNFQQFFTISV